MRHLFLLALFFPLVASAAEKPAKRTCRMLFLNPPANAPQKIFLFDGVASQEVELPEMNFSDVYTITGGDTALRLLPKAVLKPEEIPAEAPGASIAASVTDCYIVVSAEPGNKVVPLRFQIIDAGAQKFRKGQMMWYNLTSNPVGGQLGSQKLAMKGQSRTIIDAPAKADESFDVSLSYRIGEEPGFHPICQTKWTHDARSRMVMFVYGGENNSTPQIAGYKDFRVEETKPE